MKGVADFGSELNLAKTHGLFAEVLLERLDPRPVRGELSRVRVLERLNQQIVTSLGADI